MGERPPAPGLDEIVVATPPGRCLCDSREHAGLGCLAEVIVTLGQLGTRWDRGALWQDSWGRSFALCGECWGAVREVAESRRPGLVVTEATSPLPQFAMRESDQPWH